jgi:hypothetical protein
LEQASLLCPLASSHLLQMEAKRRLTLALLETEDLKAMKKHSPSAGSSGNQNLNAMMRIHQRRNNS